MKKKYKEMWVAALRSGKYQQDEGCLNSGEGMCCLGVLIDITHPNEWEPGGDFGFEFQGDDVMPSEEIYKETGLTDQQALQLAHRNDGTGDFLGKRCTFVEIADYIEREL